jgi:hypothetical protein
MDDSHRMGDKYGETKLPHLRVCVLGSGSVAAGSGIGAAGAAALCQPPGCAGHDEGDTDGTVKRIPLAGGLYAYVDAADYEWLSQYKWGVYNGYAARQESGRTIYMHRQIMQPPKSMVVDHMDGSRLNNCRSNLRVCTPAENHRNRAKGVGSASRFRGVGYYKESGKWYSGLQFKGKRFWLGYFDEEVEAARAYDYKAVECGREFAWVNLPEEWPPERRREVHARWQRQRGKQDAKKAGAKGKRTAVRAKAPTRKGRRRPTRDSKGKTRQSSRRIAARKLVRPSRSQRT